MFIRMMIEYETVSLLALTSTKRAQVRCNGHGIEKEGKKREGGGIKMSVFAVCLEATCEEQTTSQLNKGECSVVCNPASALLKPCKNNASDGWIRPVAMATATLKLHKFADI